MYDYWDLIKKYKELQQENKQLKKHHICVRTYTNDEVREKIDNYKDIIKQLEQEIDKQRNNVKKEKDKCKNAIKFIKDELVLIEQETLYDTIIYQEKINKLLKILGDKENE